MAKKVLGKGIDALISESLDMTEIPPRGLRSVPISKVVSNRNQPRKSFDEGKIDELAISIEENGLIQPIVVRERGDNFEVVVGERRLRAARRAGIKEIPVIVKDYSEDKLLELALIENIQREDLNPIEEALAYRMIIDRETITQEELSRRIGKSRSYVANMLRLLELPEEIMEHVSRGTLSVGQAKAILSLSDVNDQKNLAKKILSESLSVREVERITKKANVPRGTMDSVRDPYIEAIEEKLRTLFGTKVSVDYRNGRGSIRINFYSNEELERIMEEVFQF